MSSKKRTWFQFADENGQRFGKVLQTPSTLALTDNISQFRKEIKKEYTNTLSGTSSEQIKVFADEAAMKADIEQKNPLDPRLPLGAFQSSSAQRPLCVVVPSAPDPLNKESRNLDELIEKDLRSRSVKFIKMVHNQRSPSSLGVPHVFFTESHQTKYYSAANPEGIPICLLHEVFANFVDNWTSGACVSEQRDHQAALALMGVASQCYPTETEQHEAFNHFFSKYLGHHVRSSSPETGRSGDGALVLQVKTSPDDSSELSRYLMLIEYNSGPFIGKNNVDLCHQTFHNHGWLAKTRFPTLGLCVYGPFISVSGFVLCGKLVTEPLTPMVPCLYLPHNRPHYETVARLLACLKMAIDHLYTETRKLGDETVGLVPYDPYPYLRQIPGFDIEYECRLFDTKLLFVVQADNKLCILKFTQSYALDVHKFSYDLGAAPFIRHDGKLSGGWTYILMDYYSEEDGWLPADMIFDMQERQKIAQLMREYLDQLHEAGMVHGDFRPSNILVRQKSDVTNNSSWEIRVIDFDHCGRIGEARYPSFLNLTQIAWAEGVSMGGLMLPEHDRYFVNEYCPKYSF